MDSFLHKMGYEYKVKASIDNKDTKQIMYTVSHKYFKYLKKQANLIKNLTKNLHFFDFSNIISCILFLNKNK